MAYDACSRQIQATFELLEVIAMPQHVRDVSSLVEESQ